MEENFTMIPQSDGYRTKLFFYPTDKEVFGSILILHGMAEHCVRYHDFARFLNEEGFDVYLYNHRGHGTDCKTEDLGFFAEKNGAELVINDAITLCRYIKEHGRSEKFFVFGHSMGSLILRNVIQRYDEMDKIVLCGTTMPPSNVAAAGVTVANLLCRLQGPTHRSKLLRGMMFGDKAYKAVCTRTPSDWLTRDDAIVDSYEADPYCGFLCTTSMYRDMLLFVRDAGDEALIAKTRKDLPIYLIAGAEDPVGGCGTQIKNLARLYEKHFTGEFATCLYPDARHEILNELDRESTMHDIVGFLNDTLFTD